MKVLLATVTAALVLSLTGCGAATQQQSCDSLGSFQASVTVLADDDDDECGDDD